MPPVALTDGAPCTEFIDGLEAHDPVALGPTGHALRAIGQSLTHPLLHAASTHSSPRSHILLPHAVSTAVVTHTQQPQKRFNLCENGRSDEATLQPPRTLACSPAMRLTLEFTVPGALAAIKTPTACSADATPGAASALEMLDDAMCASPRTVNDSSESVCTLVHPTHSTPEAQADMRQATMYLTHKPQYSATLTIVTRATLSVDTPSVVAITRSTAVTSAPSAATLKTTPSVTVASHAFTPPHTPQSSTASDRPLYYIRRPPPSTQQMPLAGSVDLQHVPSTSTATPSPPHTPHASTCASDAQHRPATSIVVKPAPQQWPVAFTTIVPSQHPPETSTTPPRQSRPSTAVSAGTEHVVPSQPSSHTQRPPPLAEPLEPSDDAHTE
jgi:hypothetical protein